MFNVSAIFFLFSQFSGANRDPVHRADSVILFGCGPNSGQAAVGVPLRRFLHSGRIAGIRSLREVGIFLTIYG